MVCAISAKGSVNLDKWVFQREVYGSDAYQRNGTEMARAEQEREDARWE